jgi:uncharacterized protein
VIGRSLRFLWLCAGGVAMALAVAGAVLPLLPTTPFLLLAAYCFARSSPRLHDWLLGHRAFGPLIRDWRDRGAISRRAKRAAYLSMAAVFGLSLAFGLPWFALAVQAAALGGSALFIATRPDG